MHHPWTTKLLASINWLQITTAAVVHVHVALAIKMSAVASVVTVRLHISSYQHYVVVHFAEMLVPVPPEVTMDKAAIVTCSGITTYNAVENLKESLEEALNIKGGNLVGVLLRGV